MRSKILYENGNSKAKDPNNIKYDYDVLYDDIKESKAFRKFLKGKISFEESSEKYICLKWQLIVIFIKNSLMTL